VQKGLGDPGGTWFVWWLRATSRYLTPRGARDLVISAATYGRNMFAVHLELGLALMVLGGIVGLFNLFAWQLLYRWFAAHPEMLPAVGPLFQPWLSTLWVAMVLPVLASIPLAAAYWTIPSQRGRRWVLSEVLLSLLLATLGTCGGRGGAGGIALGLAPRRRAACVLRGARGPDAAGGAGSADRAARRGRRASRREGRGRTAGRARRGRAGRRCAGSAATRTACSPAPSTPAPPRSSATGSPAGSPTA
jgi:hypothetical protein